MEINSLQPAKRNYIPNLRILYIAHTNKINEGGGASIALYNMIQDIKKRYNIIPFVLLPSEGEFAEKCRENGIEVFITPYIRCALIPQKKSCLYIIKETLKYFPRKIWNYFRLKKALQLLRNKHFDIIHTNTSVIDIGAKLAQVLSIPHVWQLHEYGYDFIEKDSYIRQQFNKTKAVIAISSAVYEYYSIVKKLCPPDNVKIIYGGVKISEKYNKIYKHTERVNFCMVGNIDENKNQLMAINACLKLKNFIK